MDDELRDETDVVLDVLIECELDDDDADDVDVLVLDEALRLDVLLLDEDDSSSSCRPSTMIS